MRDPLAGRRLPGKKLTVRQAVKIDGYKVEIGTPKTRAAIRTVGLDAATVHVLKDWRDLQLDELERLGAKATLVFTEADGTMIRRRSTGGSRRRPRGLAHERSGCTGCVTRMQRWRSKLACR